MNLQDFFNAFPKAAMGFSGGTDSAYLLYAAIACGAQVQPYFVRTPFQPAFEERDARNFADLAGAELKVIEYPLLTLPEVRQNTEKRCYYCKKIMFEQIRRAALEDGYALVMDGTNASKREGREWQEKALQEENIVSPLKLCGLTKEEIRKRALEAELFIWDKPEYTCLADHIPCGRTIFEETLREIEQKGVYIKD